MADDNEGCIAKYMGHFLKCLFPDEFEPISYEDNSLLLILCIADTVEPSKTFPYYCNEDVLNLLSIEYSLKGNLRKRHGGLQTENVRK